MNAATQHFKYLAGSNSRAAHLLDLFGRLQYYRHSTSFQISGQWSVVSHNADPGIYCSLRADR